MAAPGFNEDGAKIKDLVKIAGELCEALDARITEEVVGNLDKRQKELDLNLQSEMEAMSSFGMINNVGTMWNKIRNKLHGLAENDKKRKEAMKAMEQRLQNFVDFYDEENIKRKTAKVKEQLELVKERNQKRAKAYEALLKKRVIAEQKAELIKSKYNEIIKNLSEKIRQREDEILSLRINADSEAAKASRRASQSQKKM